MPFVAHAPDTVRSHAVHLALCASSECLDRFEPILRTLVVGLVDHVSRMYLISPDPRMEKLAFGPTHAIIRPFPRWPISRRRLMHIAESVATPLPGVVHSLSGPSYSVGFSLAEEFDADLVFQVTSHEDCSELERYVGQHIGRILCFTEPLARILQQQLKTPPELIELVRPGISAAARPACFAKTDRAPTVVCTAPFTRTGGVDRVIEAAQIIQNRGRRAMFFLLGQGPFESTLRQRARDLGVLSSVAFTHPGGNPFDVISSADVFVHPSSSGSLYLDALQAMARGLAVVTVPDPIADFLHHGETALVCDGGSATQLADGVDDLLTDRSLGQRIAANAIEYIRTHHSMSTMADRTGAVYRQLLLARSTFALRE